MAESFKDQEFVEFVVKSIVNHPEDVRAERTVDDRGVLLTLHINQEDMGYVIGRQGQTARALRILLKTVGAKDNARVNLKIFEPDELRRQHQETKGSSMGMGAPGMSAPSTSASAAPASTGRHGAAGMVSDEDLADLGI